MTSILINLFYFAVLALVIAAGMYLYRTRDPAAGTADEPGDTGEPEEEDGTGPKTFPKGSS